MSNPLRSDLATSDRNARYSEGCLYRTGKSVILGASAGVIMGAIGVMWYPDPIRFGHKGTVVPVVQDIAYVLRGLKMPVTWGTLVLGTFTGVECLVENMRDPKKESTYVNAMAGGAAAGAMMGAMTKRLDIVSVTAFGMSLLMGMVDYNGQRLAMDPAHQLRKEDIRISLTEEETDTLKELKEKYPEFKHL